MASPSPTPPSLSPTPHPTHPHVPQPQSKRDKRRSVLSDRLNHLTRGFHNPTDPRIRDRHYRYQLSSIQADMQLVTGSNVSGGNMRLMDDSGEAVKRDVENVFLGTPIRMEDVGGEGLAGRWYSKFLQSVNDTMEERDTQLVLLCNQHRQKSQSILAQHTRSIVHAREEHRSLAGSIQARLSARLKTQLKKIATEKETSSMSANALSSLSAGGYTDITDSNALLLHPSHFGLAASIGSPRRHGGSLGYDDDTEKEASTRRKPRRRAGEVEELMAFGVGMNFDPTAANGKRKRRGGGAANEILDDIPTPPTFNGPLDANSPSAEANAFSNLATETREEKRRKREEMMKQVYAPIYSLEKLFSEKELQLHSNQATLATVRYFSERAANKEHDSDHQLADDDDDSPTGANTPVPGGQLTTAADEDEEDTEERALGYGPGTDLTRGMPALPGFGGINTRSNPPRQLTREMENLVLGGVTNVGMSYVNKTGVAPAPPGLRPEDAEADLVFLRKSSNSSKRNSGALGGGNNESSKRQKRSG